MAIRGNPTRQGFPAIGGRVIVDTYRGVIRIRSWPKKRGPRATPAQARWRAWFREANKLAIRAPGSQMATAIRMAKGTGLYPRDILIKAMSVGFSDAITQNGDFMRHRWNFLEPVMYQGVSLNLGTNQAITANVETSVQWTLPEIDTAGFWSAADDTIITIPEDVDWIGFQASYRPVANVAGISYLAIERVLPSILRIVQSSGPDGYASSVAAAPWHVEQGETYRVRVFFSNARTLLAGPATSFSATILQTSV